LKVPFSKLHLSEAVIIEDNCSLPGLFANVLNPLNPTQMQILFKKDTMKSTGIDDKGFESKVDQVV